VKTSHKPSGLNATPISVRYRVGLEIAPRALLYPNQGAGVLEIPAGQVVRKGDHFNFYPYQGLLE
jgi:hypothetical protein